ncbi:MAG: hypothetical protein M3Z08_11335 [Chloroflexota bacterium]|nr:hypothetical protein [Chloroflexota bacterium]
MGGENVGTPIHPLALRVMEAVGIGMSLQYPKHLNEFSGQHFDIIVTVCDRVLESCPTFPDDPERIYWSFLDPATVAPEVQYHAFEQTSLQLTTRIRFLLTLLQHKKGSHS